MIMDVSALRDGKMQLNLTKTVNCNEICEEVWELMNMAVDKNGKKIKKDSVDLQIECDPDLPVRNLSRVERYPRSKKIFAVRI